MMIIIKTILQAWNFSWGSRDKNSKTFAKINPPQHSGNIVAPIIKTLRPKTFLKFLTIKLAHNRKIKTLAMDRIPLNSKSKMENLLINQAASKKNFLITKIWPKILKNHKLNLLGVTLPIRSSLCLNLNPKRSFTKNSSRKAVTFLPLKNPNPHLILKHHLPRWMRDEQCCCPMIFTATISTQPSSMSYRFNSVKLFTSVRKKLHICKVLSKDKLFSFSFRKKQKMKESRKSSILMLMPSITFLSSETSQTKKIQANLFYSIKKICFKFIKTFLMIWGELSRSWGNWFLIKEWTNKFHLRKVLPHPSFFNSSKNHKNLRSNQSFRTNWNLQKFFW